MTDGRHQEGADHGRGKPDQGTYVRTEQKGEGYVTGKEEKVENKQRWEMENGEKKGKGEGKFRKRKIKRNQATEGK